MITLPSSPRLILKIIAQYTSYREIAKSLQLVSLSALKQLKSSILDRHASLTFVRYICSDICNWSYRSKHMNQKNISFMDTEYLESNEDLLVYGNELFTFICTDKSNCGSLKSILFDFSKKALSKFVDEDYYLDIFCIGRSISYFLARRYRDLIRKTIVNIAKEASAFYLSYALVSKILEFKFDTCTLLFTRFISNKVQYVTRYTFNSFNNFFLSLVYLCLQGDQVAILLITKWVRFPTLLSDFYYYAVSLLLLDCIEELEYCEIAARATAMEQTVNNLDELISWITLKYNKARQAAITNQILEILGASENM